MTLHKRIDRHADQYKQEGARMAQRAMEQIDRQIAFINRSLGQKKRYLKGASNGRLVLAANNRTGAIRK